MTEPLHTPVIVSNADPTRFSRNTLPIHRHWLKWNWRQMCLWKTHMFHYLVLWSIHDQLWIKVNRYDTYVKDNQKEWLAWRSPLLKVFVSSLNIRAWRRDVSVMLSRVECETCFRWHIWFLWNYEAEVKCDNSVCIDPVTIHIPPLWISLILCLTLAIFCSRLFVNLLQDVKAKALKSLLDEFGLYQYIILPTHVKWHTLDLVIGDDRHPQIIRDTRTLSHGSVESDNFPVCFNITLKKPKKVKIIQYRKWFSLDIK